MPALYLLQMMKSESKTLYIPLYGKDFVSQKGIILEDNILQGPSREVAIEGNAEVQYKNNTGVTEYNKKSVAEPL